MNKKENRRSPVLGELLESIDPKELERTKYKMLIAARIEDAMRAKGWMKKDLMKALNITSPSILTRWFSGTHNFTVETLIDIQSVLEVELINVRPNFIKSVYSVSITVNQTVTDAEFSPE